MNISHQLFYYKITFVNSQRKNTNSKGGFGFKKISGIQKDFWNTKINLSQKYMEKEFFQQIRPS